VVLAHAVVLAVARAELADGVTVAATILQPVITLTSPHDSGIGVRCTRYESLLWELHLFVGAG